MATAKASSKIRPFRVLSLDGGGMRGIYTAAFLDRLTTHFAKPKSNEPADLGQSFDLITGTSTGAIVACALAIGKPMNDVVALYKEHGRKIFPHRIKGKMSAIYRAFRGGSIVRAVERFQGARNFSINTVSTNEQPPRMGFQENCGERKPR